MVSGKVGNTLHHNKKIKEEKTMAIQFNPFTASQDYLNKKKKSDEYNSQIENYGDFTQSDYLNQIQQNKINAENAVKNYGDFSYYDEDVFQKARKDYLNREKFYYDLNGDALYQQYKDQYMRQGNMAMLDTIGQASAMTGGYGNSYAQSVGQQTYQGYLQQLNDKVPELYQLALSRYAQEGQDLLNKYSLLADDRNFEYGKYNDVYDKLVANRDYEGNNYYNQYNLESGDYDRRLANLKDLYSIANSAANTLYDQEFGVYNTDIANKKWQEEYNLSERAQDQSDTISALKNQISGLEDKYSGYISPDEQTAGSSKAVNLFNASIMTKNEFLRHGKSTTIDGNERRFDNYNQYVSAELEHMYKSGKLTENEVAFIAKSRGITE